MKVKTGDRVKLDARAFPKQAHVTWVVADFPETPASEIEAFEIARARVVNVRAGDSGPWLVKIHVEDKPEKWRTAWTSHLLPAGLASTQGLDLGQFSTGVLAQFAELAVRMGDLDLHAHLVAEIERRG